MIITFARMRKTINRIAMAALAFALMGACNNEPPECATEQFPPLHCQLAQLSGKKIDTTIIYMPGIDSVLYMGAGLPATVKIPLSTDADTTFVQFTLIGFTTTAIEKENSMLGITSEPELTITNLECGPFYCFRNLGYTLYSLSGVEPVYEILLDTFYVDTTYSTAIYDTTGLVVDSVLKNERLTLVDTIWRKTGVVDVDYQMAVDSLHYYTTEVDEEYEVHAKIFF